MYLIRETPVSILLTCHPMTSLFTVREKQIEFELGLRRPCKQVAR